MSSNQNDSNSVPSWDEFNMISNDDEDDINLNNNEDNNLLLDGPIDEDNNQNNDEIVVEPGQPQVEEYGPSLPPGFGVDDLNDGQPPQFAENNDFSAPFGTNDLDLDDPEDPLQCNTSNSLSNNQRNMTSSSSRSIIIGPSIPSSLLPRIPVVNRGGDEHFLPSIGNYNASSSSSAVVDFIPLCDQPSSSSSNINNNHIIGPTLPPDLNLLPNNGGGGHAEFDDIESPIIPPDEPQICNNTNSTSSHHYQQNRHNKKNNFGPTLPSSSEDENDNDEEDQEVQNILQEEENLAQIAINEVKDQEDDFNNIIGPIPPVPGRSEEEEQYEYLARLAEFEANKKASNGLIKREEWMTELPQKMLKTGAYGLSSKTSFSRSSAGPCSVAAGESSVWTSVPNGGGQKNTFVDFDGPSTSSSSTSSNIPKPPISSKRSEQDELAEKRAAELNKERNESLLDIHQKKRKLENNKNGGESSSSGTKLLYSTNAERRPFNRDTDIEVRGLGNSSKKGSSSSTDPSSLKERVGDLSNRFGNSSDKKFL